MSDDATLQQIAERYAAQGWPARAGGGAITAEYSAPSAGPPPWDLYVLTPTTAFGLQPLNRTAPRVGSSRIERGRPDRAGTAEDEEALEFEHELEEPDDDGDDDE